MSAHLPLLAVPSDPVVSPDGDRVAFVVSRPDLEEDRYVSEIWLRDGAGARRFTTGGNDASPRWSPDGTRLAFLRKVEDRSQLAVIPTDGGEPRILTDFPLGALGVASWSPDGSRIAVTGVVWEEGWADLDDEERRRRPRRIQERVYRADGLGWLDDRRRFVFLVDAETGEARRLTDGVDDETSPVWGPGGEVAFLSDDRTGYVPGSEVWVAGTDGSLRRGAPRGMWYVLGYSPPGELHALGYPGTEFPDQLSLWRLGDDPVHVPEDDRRAFLGLGAGPEKLVFDEGRVLVPRIDSGRVGVAAVTPAGSVDVVVDADAAVTGFDAAGGTLAYTISTNQVPGRLVVEREGAAVVLDDFGNPQFTSVEPEHFVVASGDVDLDAWVYLPDGDGPVPLLLNIHGGPASQYGWGYFDEFQVYVRAGYGVVATNPRGSGGRDREFLQAVRGEGWGNVDVEDVDAVVGAALERFPRLDSERMGVMGGSYGGFLTAWLIAHQDRWRAAIVERALLSWPSFGGTSDIGGWFADAYLGDRELEWQRSPLRLASQVKTPTLIIHSENDFRCPIEQAEQYFDALLRAGVETEFVRFPGEGHEMSRSGTPRHREERFGFILDWLERWL